MKVCCSSLRDRIMSEVENLILNIEKACDKNNKSAARRARKSSILLSKLLKEWRKKSVKEIG